MPRPLLLSLVGSSGAGKSTLAKHLQARGEGRFVRVPVDFFLVPRGEESLAEYLDRPLSYDWAAIDRALAATGPARSAPDVDFETFRRRAPTGGPAIAEGRIAVLDWMRPHPRTDVLVIMELAPRVQRRRLRERDLRWGTAVGERRAHLAATYAQGRADLTRPADGVIDASDPIEVSVLEVLRAIRRHRDR